MQWSGREASWLDHVSPTPKQYCTSSCALTRAQLPQVEQIQNLTEVWQHKLWRSDIMRLARRRQPLAAEGVAAGAARLLLQRHVACVDAAQNEDAGHPRRLRAAYVMLERVACRAGMGERRGGGCCRWFEGGAAKSQRSRLPAGDVTAAWRWHLHTCLLCAHQPGTGVLHTGPPCATLHATATHKRLACHSNTHALPPSRGATAARTYRHHLVRGQVQHGECRFIDHCSRLQQAGTRARRGVIGVGRRRRMSATHRAWRATLCRPLASAAPRPATHPRRAPRTHPLPGCPPTLPISTTSPPSCL